jgi:hypothetical protein
MAKFCMVYLNLKVVYLERPIVILHVFMYSFYF